MIPFFEIIIFILPAYFANAVPVLVGGGTKVDLGKKFFDGRRVFGDGKTIQGFVGGVCAGIIISAILSIYFPLEFFGNEKMQFFSGVTLAFGTMFGDLLGSFIKRRMNVGPGKPFLMDQLSFLIIAMIFAYPFSPIIFYSISSIVFLFVITYLSHVLSNYAANKLGLKNVPW
ncbi:MAG: CDP-2,3-bis-(O-geranylgeranyl)-sn-glycerol synthase [Candidatus ainarchaeum sp.]|nr:CDP-2,3-bis-(O-geranylgeranyl)-sn-glycerol synthase [Candidatus ainarchaeum sp.]